MEETSRTGVRLNKYLSEAGVCSRREADLAIEAGEVMIDGRVAVLGDRVQEGETVIFREKVVEHKEPEVLLLLNKPRGIVCTAEKKEKNNIVDYLNYPVRVYPVGRLDKDSRGLILLTNQGDLVNKLNRGGNYHEKEYVVKIDQEVTADFVVRMSRGVYLTELHVKTRPCKVWKTSYDTFHIILTQGLNRQIRRMCEMCGVNVKDLLRIRIMDLNIGDLEEGAYRELTEEEKNHLIASLKDSYSDPKPYGERKSYGRRPNGHKNGGYRGGNREGGYNYNRGNRSNGYNREGGNREGGYTRENRSNGYNREGGNREGGYNYNRENRSNGYNREGGNREGGYNYNKGNRSESYNREGGYNYNRENRSNGYNREDGHNYNRGNRSGSYNREGGYNYNRENRSNGYNREGGYNRENRSGRSYQSGSYSNRDHHGDFYGKRDE